MIDFPYKGPVDWRGLPIKRPYPWEHDVTVCIAAGCKHGEERLLVFCTDRKSGSVLGSAETSLKERVVAPHWYCLTSGTAPDIEALVGLYRSMLTKPNALPDLEHMYEFIAAPLYRRKYLLANEYIRGRFAISYDDFLRAGRDQFPPETFQEVFRGVDELRLGIDFIVTGFRNDRPFIFHCDDRCRVRESEDFAVCGEGAYLAQAALTRRKQTYVTSLYQTLYNVYEAKRYAEGVGSVGSQQTVLSILRHSENFTKSVPMGGDMLAELKRLYEKEYGPKDLPMNFELTSPLPI